MHLLAIVMFVGSACATGLAIAVLATARRSLPRWSFAAGMIVFAAEALFGGLSVDAVGHELALQWQQRRLFALSLLPGAWLLFSLTYARGNGRQLLAGAVVPLAGAAIAPALWIVAQGNVAWPLETEGAAANAHIFRLPWNGIVLFALFLLGSVGVMMNLERTFRASIGTIRWRIKFTLLGVGVIFIARIYTSSQALVFRGLDTNLDSINAGALILATPLILRSFLRAGNFDLDVYPSRAVLQGSVTLLLAGVYLLLIGVLAKAVTYFGGEDAFAVKALLVLVALVALTIVLQSDRANQQLRQFVSRHFQRPVYDYRIVWSKFTQATASQVDQAAVAQAIPALVADVFQALSVSLWITDEKQDTLKLAASTCTRGSEPTDVERKAVPALEVIAHFRLRAGPVDIEGESAAWAVTLRALHGTQFPNGGHRVCAPLVSRGEVIGAIILGDRIGGAPFLLQDVEMLRCVADQAAARLMNVQLSQKLMQAKELEAFQAMAAFFVHDLKNAASTLNLMLQNLPVHFDNPEFRADALRGIAKTVTHINQIIRRLGQLRHELKIELAEADLNEVVSQALAGLEHPADATLIKEVHPLPLIRVDGDQLNKVITNLVLNATEAIPTAGGRVRVATSRQDEWVVLTVDDNGCGMSSEFMSRSLFRPFQTTKPSGLGIGMFQSKMIIEAHGGRIAVASEPGRGTTFQVFLRAAAQAN